MKRYNGRHGRASGLQSIGGRNVVRGERALARTAGPVVEQLEQRMLLTLTIPSIIATGPEMTNNRAKITCDVAVRNADWPDAHTVVINWGDNTANTTRTAYPDPSDEDFDGDDCGHAVATHVYADRNPHTITVTVTNGNNESLTQTVQTTPILVPPTLDLGADSARGALGDPFTLNVAVSDPGGNEITEYAVDWGDGGTPQVVTGAPPASLTHTYTTSGRHPITLRAIDPNTTWSAPYIGRLTYDSTFGSGVSGNTAGMGRIINNFGDALSGTPWEWSAALAAPAAGADNAGKIVAAGDSDAFLLARYNPDGTLDTSFGGNNTGFNKQRFDQLNSEWQLTGQCSDAVAQADGKLVLAGSVYGPSTGYDFAVARFNADGTVDATFGNTGAAATDFGPGIDARANALAIDPGTGAITLAGFAGGDLAIARYTAAGAPDTTFGSGTGKLTIDLGATADIAYGLTLQPEDGKILVTGRSGSDLVVARFNSDGTPDTSFNLTGRRLLDIGGPGDFGYEVAVDPLGRILAAGEAGGHVLLVRLTGYGLPDTTFGGGDGILEDAALAGYWWGVSFQADGRLLVGGGGTDNTPAARPALILGRYLDDGTPDPTFGEAGRVISATGLSRTEVHALGVLDPGEGKISVAGMTLSTTGMYDFLIAQYLPENGALVAPAAPSELTASVFSDTQIDLTYTDNSSDEDGFILEASTDGENFFPVGYADADETSASAEGLDPSTVYWLRVRAENDGVESEPSPAVKTRTAVTEDDGSAIVNVGGYTIFADGSDPSPDLPTLEEGVRYRLTISGSTFMEEFWDEETQSLASIYGDAEYAERMDSSSGSAGPDDSYEGVDVGVRLGGVDGDTWWGPHRADGTYTIDVIGTGDELTAAFLDFGSNADDTGYFTLNVDRVVPYVTIETAAGAEYTTEGSPTRGRFIVRRSGGSLLEPLTVQYTIGGSATNGTDYTALSGSITIEAGEDSAEIEVAALSDLLEEGEETVELTVSATEEYEVGAPGSGGTSGVSATVVITDLPVVWVTADDDTAVEESEAADPAIFTLHRADGAGSLDVYYELGGDAIYQTDYYLQGNPASLVAHFADGQTELPVTAIAIDDDIDESTEFIEFTLLADPGSTPAYVLASQAGSQADTRPTDADGKIVNNEPNDGVVDLDLEGVDEADEEDEGGYVPINADNDNGSQVTGYRPAHYDFETSGYNGEDDLLKLTVALPNSDFGVVSLAWSNVGAADVRLWWNTTKTSEFQSGDSISLSGTAQTLYVEGIARSNQLDDCLTFVAESGEDSDTVVARVTPILDDLTVTTVDGNVAPKASTHDGEWRSWTKTKGPLANDPVKFEIETMAKGVRSGELDAVQNARNINFLEGQLGAVVQGGAVVGWRFDFAGANAGQFLLDAEPPTGPNDADWLPFYGGEFARGFNGEQMWYSSDRPSLPLGLVLPQNDGETTEFDVIQYFRLYAVWHFPSNDGIKAHDVIYVLGYTDWSVRHHASIRNDKMTPVIAGQAGNAITPHNTVVQGDNRPLAIVPPVAPTAGATWTR